MRYATGWINNDRSRTWLRANQLRFDRSHFMCYRIPAEVNNLGKAPILDQGDVGACSGFSDAVITGLENLAKTGVYVQPSPMFDYITNQICDLDGKLPTEDTGATIAAAAEARAKFGSCHNSLKVFTGKYDPSITQDAYADGLLHTESSHSVLSTVPQIVQYIGTVGLVQIGIPVGQRFQECSGILTLADVMADCRNPEGGHALPAIGFLLPATVAALGFKTQSQRLYFPIQNSWTDAWGYKGFCLMEWEALAYLCSLINHGDVEIVGKSSLKTFDDPGTAKIDMSGIYAAAA